MHIGVLSRRGSSGSDIKVSRRMTHLTCMVPILSPAGNLFDSGSDLPDGFPGHVSTAYEDASGRTIIDVTVSPQNVFFWWPDAAGKAPNPQTITTSLSRFVINQHATDLDLPRGKILQDANVQFPRINDRFATMTYTNRLGVPDGSTPWHRFSVHLRRHGRWVPTFPMLAKIDNGHGES